jgi:hypothetical protein
MSNTVSDKLISLVTANTAANTERSKQVCEVLDTASKQESIEAVPALGGHRFQSALWKVVEENVRITTADLLAPDIDPMRPVVFHGKNSLPVFSNFKKICCRPPADHGKDVLWGYNDTSLLPLIGPGYFVVHDTESSPLGGTAFDYTKLPTSHPEQWPEIRPNHVGLSRFIYNNTIDFMRRVSRDVFIGAATRHDKSMDSYFVLFRDLP